MSEIFNEEELQKFPETAQKILRGFSRLIVRSFDFHDRYTYQLFDVDKYIDQPDEFANKKYTPENFIEERLDIRDKKRSK